MITNACYDGKCLQNPFYYDELITISSWMKFMQVRNQTEIFNMVYLAAQKGDQAALVQLVSQKVMLDPKDASQIYTPAGKLATEGNEAAVNLLQSFGASDDYIALGYASVGNHKEAERMRREKGVRLDYLLLGAAMFNNNDYTRNLLTRFKIHPEFAVLGATYRGDEAFVDELFSSIDKIDVIQIARLAQLNALVTSGRLFQGSQLRDKFIFSGDYLKHAETITRINPENIFYYRQLLNPNKNFPIALNLRDPQLNLSAEKILVHMDHSRYWSSRPILVYELAFVKSQELLKKLSETAKIMLNRSDPYVPFVSTSFHNNCYLHFEECCQQALTLQSHMQIYLFDFDQAHEFIVNKPLAEALAAFALKDARLPYLATSLSSELLGDMTRKYLLASAKRMLDERLQRHYEEHYSMWNPCSGMGQHLERTQSLREACLNASPRQIHKLVMLQFGLFNGTIKLAADPAKPKHEQPLVSDAKNNGFYAAVKEIVESPRFKIFSGN